MKYKQFWIRIHIINDNILRKFYSSSLCSTEILQTSSTIWNPYDTNPRELSQVKWLMGALLSRFIRCGRSFFGILLTNQMNVLQFFFFSFAVIKSKFDGKLIIFRWLFETEAIKNCIRIFEAAYRASHLFKPTNQRTERTALRIYQYYFNCDVCAKAFKLL